MQLKNLKENISANRKTIIECAIAIAAILILGIALAKPTINHFPAFTHAWAQADWYSLSIGFQNNGFDFLHPETLIYNKQYPGYWMTDDGTTATSANFPIHNYIVAILMSLFGTTAPWVFRCWTLTISLIGLFFLFLLCRRLTKNLIKSLTVVCMAMTSPVYAYYFDGFLPSMPSLTFVFAGLWAYIVFLQDKNMRYWYLSISFLTFATLIRTSQAVPLVAVCCYEVYRMLFINKKLQFNKKQTISIIISILAIGGYILWNAHLRKLNGSLFLNSLMPAKSFDDVNSVIDIMKWRKYRYFAEIQHYLVSEAILAAIAYMILNKMKINRNSLIWFAAIYSFGALLFFTAMLVQFHDHDYYFLDSLYVPVILIFTLAVRQLPELNRWWKACSAVLLIVFGCTMFNAAKHDIRNTISDTEDRALQCNANFEGSCQWLDSLGVSRNAKILTLGAYPQNSPFIKMQRNGYAAMQIEDWLISKVMDFDFDYVIIENEIARAQHDKLCNALEQLELIDKNRVISLYKRK
ncbi:MAG: glycosyltransferase family 39 protein [Salinivirgaceae bacterium]|nr:glycosyltransferase family 39 protein [Salinivirgaceae bacterium]